VSDDPGESVSKVTLRWAVLKLVFVSVIALANVRAGVESGHAIHWVAVGLAVLLAGYNGWLVRKAHSST
jgi:uncharacterized membrane protein